MLAVDAERADVQHGQVSRKLLEQRAAAGIPHLQDKMQDVSPEVRGQAGRRRARAGPTMVELEASSPAHTSVPPPVGLLKTAFLVSSLQDEPAAKVWTGEQEQLGGWPESCRGVRVRAIRTQRSHGLERPATRRADMETRGRGDAQPQAPLQPRPTWPVGDQAVAALRLHLDVDAAGGLQGELVRPVAAVAHLLPETRPLQGAGDQAAAGEGAGRRLGDIRQGRYRTPATRRARHQTGGGGRGRASAGALLPGAQRLQLVHVRAGVSGVVDEHRAVVEAGVDVVAVVQTPAAAPDGTARLIGLHHRVGQQTARTHTHTHTRSFHSPAGSGPCVCLPGEFDGAVQACRQQQAVLLPVEGQSSDLLAVDGDVLAGLHGHGAHLLDAESWNGKQAEVMSREPRHQQEEDARADQEAACCVGRAARPAGSPAARSRTGPDSPPPGTPARPWRSCTGPSWTRPASETGPARRRTQLGT